MSFFATAPYDPARAAALSAAQRICRREAPEVYRSAFFLPAEKRRAVNAVTALCCMIADAMDVPSSQPLRGATAMRDHPAVISPRALPVIQPQHDESHCEIDSPASRLEMLRDRLDEIYANQLELPAWESRSAQQHALHAFVDAIRTFEVPKAQLLAFAEGCRMKLATPRLSTGEELTHYCRSLGGSMARALGSVLGATHSEAGSYAIQFGSALTLIGILRDLCQEVRVSGRIPLPQEDLDRFGYDRDELIKGIIDERLRSLIRFEVNRARQWLGEGSAGICWLAGDGSRMMAASLAVTGAGVLDTIERHDYDVLTRRTQPDALHRLARLPRAWKLARREHDQPLPNVL